MAHDPDLDHLTTLLGQCLGRIDERAYQLQQLGDEGCDLDAHEVLAAEATTLRELVGSLLDRCTATATARLDAIVERAIGACLQELGGGVLVRQRLATDLPPIACNPGELACAVQRALGIAATRLEVGGELLVTTRREGDAILLEIESRGRARDRHLQERAQTLCEFVAACRGHCRVELDELGNLLIALELPEALVVDDR